MLTSIFGNFGNIFNVSPLVTRNNTQINLEKSSIITSAYLFPLRIHVLIGPNKYICNKSKALEDEV